MRTAANNACPSVSIAQTLAKSPGVSSANRLVGGRSIWIPCVGLTASTDGTKSRSERPMAHLHWNLTCGPTPLRVITANMTRITFWLSEATGRSPMIGRTCLRRLHSYDIHERGASPPLTFTSTSHTSKCMAYVPTSGTVPDTCARSIGVNPSRSRARMMASASVGKIPAEHRLPCMSR